MGLFIRDDGYTSVAVAVALLVSLTLAFAAASAEWTMARSGDVQVIADATAMAGSNAVAAFCTVAQVLDACVLSMGLAGVLVCAAGMVVAAIPFLQEAAPAILDVGRSILDARRGFARSAAQGLSKLEAALPALIMANSASCVSANCDDDGGYFGCAVPFPQESGSDFSHLDDGLDHKELDAQAERMREASAERERALTRAQDARERAWRADCVDAPLCMRSRAETLAGLTGTGNPYYESATSWRFGYALTRARNYYLVRTRHERPAGGSVDDMVRSAARRAFYEYAYDELGHATCVEEGEVILLDLPSLPHTRDEVRATRLYEERRWPCTTEQAGVTLHASSACPGAVGAATAPGSLAGLERGSLLECPTCHMNLTTMGSVASASTNISNGFEHYWRIVVEASCEFQAAHDEAERAQAQMAELAERGASAFERAMRTLSVDRPRLCPPGAWGCVSVVVRKGGTTVPSELTAAFLSSAQLPPGAAMAAATLAPDDASTQANNVLSRVLDGVRQHGSLITDLLGNVTELWGRLLVGYGSGVDTVTSTANDLFDRVGTVLGERVATWLKDKLASIVKLSGLQPADMRLRKPVLVGSQAVLDKVGADALAKARELVDQLPDDARELTRANWAKVASILGYGELTVAELPIPGTNLTIPLTIDLERLADAA